MKIKGYLFLTVAMFMMTILFFGREAAGAMTSWSEEQNIGFVINPHKHLTVHH